MPLPALEFRFGLEEPYWFDSWKVEKHLGLIHSVPSVPTEGFWDPLWEGLETWGLRGPSEPPPAQAVTVCPLSGLDVAGGTARCPRTAVTSQNKLSLWLDTLVAFSETMLCLSPHAISPPPFQPFPLISFTCGKDPAKCHLLENFFQFPPKWMNFCLSSQRFVCTIS